MGKRFKTSIIVSCILLDIFITVGIYLLYGFLWKPGNSFLEEIVNYSIYRSIFDVILFAIVRAIFIIILYSWFISNENILPLFIISIISTIIIGIKVSIFALYSSKNIIPFIICTLVVVCSWCHFVVSKIFMGSTSYQLILNETRDNFEPIINYDHQPKNLNSYRPIKPIIEDNISSVEPIRISKSVGNYSYINNKENLPLLSNNTYHPQQFQLHKKSFEQEYNNNIKELLDILILMKDEKYGVKLKDNRRLNRLINNCISGYDLIEWTLNNINTIKTREKAISTLQKMLDNGYIYHYKSHLTFKDFKDEFYLFKENEYGNINSDNEDNEIHIDNISLQQFISQPLIKFISQMKEELNIKDRTLFDLKTKTSKIYYQCFEGTEAVDWLVLNKKFFNSETSKLFMNLLLITETIYTIGDEKENKSKIKNIMLNSRLNDLSTANKDISFFNLRNYYRFNDDENINENGRINENYLYNIEKAFKKLNELINDIKVINSNEQVEYNYWFDSTPSNEKFIIESDANFGSLESQSDYE